jgi:hypothetical protein
MINSSGFVIPPTQLVDLSYPAYKGSECLLNPTNAVGGSFTPSLDLFPVRRPDMNNPPTALVGFGSGTSGARVARV